ncbi:MAG: BatA domain-containing protein [Planctomycetes bacterium]|nr:BatA domain-containing protein [Planctomycetota bacterium]
MKNVSSLLSTFAFESPDYLFLLLAIIVLAIFALIRGRPRERTVGSLFLLKRVLAAASRSRNRRIPRIDPPLLFSILFVLFASLSASGPEIISDSVRTANFTVFVDSSISMPLEGDDVFGSIAETFRRADIRQEDYSFILVSERWNSGKLTLPAAKEAFGAQRAQFRNPDPKALRELMLRELESGSACVFVTDHGFGGLPREIEVGYHGTGRINRGITASGVEAVEDGWSLFFRVESNAPSGGDYRWKVSYFQRDEDSGSTGSVKQNVDTLSDAGMSEQVLDFLGQFPERVELTIEFEDADFDNSDYLAKGRTIRAMKFGGFEETGCLFRAIRSYGARGTIVREPSSANLIVDPTKDADTRSARAIVYTDPSLVFESPGALSVPPAGGYYVWTDSSTGISKYVDPGLIPPPGLALPKKLPEGYQELLAYRAGTEEFTAVAVKVDANVVRTYLVFVPLDEPAFRESPGAAIFAANIFEDAIGVEPERGLPDLRGTSDPADVAGLEKLDSPVGICGFYRDDLGDTVALSRIDRAETTDKSLRRPLTESQVQRLLSKKTTEIRTRLGLIFGVLALLSVAALILISSRR